MLSSCWFARNVITRRVLNLNSSGRISWTDAPSTPAQAGGALRSTIVALSVLSVIVAMSGDALAADTYDYRGVCPSPNGGKRILDKWNFWECECVSYSADKLNERGVPFRGSYKDGSWGGASNWLNAAKRTGTPYSKYPRRGDVAWWSSGHVAYVEAVDSYGNATISEYNWGIRHDYHTRTVKRGAASYPTYFIHF